MENKDEHSPIDENDLNNQGDQPEDGKIIDETSEIRHKRVRRRIKVRKKLRVRKKPSIEKKLKKFAEKAFWFVIIVGFIVALIVMVVELDIRDSNLKQKKKATPAKFYVPVKGNIIQW